VGTISKLVTVRRKCQLNLLRLSGEPDPLYIPAAKGKDSAVTKEDEAFRATGNVIQWYLPKPQILGAC
jgi:hypothetical protein